MVEFTLQRGKVFTCLLCLRDVDIPWLQGVCSHGQMSAQGVHMFHYSHVLWRCEGGAGGHLCWGQLCGGPAWGGGGGGGDQITTYFGGGGRVSYLSKYKSYPHSIKLSHTPLIANSSFNMKSCSKHLLKPAKLSSSFASPNSSHMPAM